MDYASKLTRSNPGRGRGRGIRKNPTGNHAGSGTGLPQQTQVTKPGNAWGNARAFPAKPQKQAPEAFLYESSSEEEDGLDEDAVLNSTMKIYTDALDGDSAHITSSAIQHLYESCQSGAIICLVCISSVKRQEAIWNCSSCYAIFHLGCIQRWVREGTARNAVLSDEHFPNKDQPWFCPKCRFEYKQLEAPTRYTCYCGNVDDPPFDPWLLPHTCGSTCDRPLKPQCGHRCLLLCHPGPCPPCPKTVRIGCHCGKKPKTVRRCGAASWSCGDKCGKLLECGIHRCQDNCHEGNCQTCIRTSVRPCLCGKHREERPCAELKWDCGDVCGKPFSCGSHCCEKVCHSGHCGECPRSGLRTCPCGKSIFSKNISCVDEVPTCEDTCGKSLGCYGGHKCSRRCHYGPCGPCPLMVEKQCRCERKKKEAPCHKEFLCDLKCQKLRDCGNHQCKRKCCDGICMTCEQTCGRTLQCKKHKCQSRCHRGPCYPCILTSRITCKCGSTGLTVVCGKEKRTRPPRCRKPCKALPSCHHPARRPHNCHFGDCPTCTQTCNIKMNCGHSCPANCHDEVLVKNKVKVAGPWELPYQGESTVEHLPCPPCRYPVPMQCLGEHETANLPCCEAGRYPCGRKCGRQLKCGNHTCELMCHKVEGAPDEFNAGSNCAECEKPCAKPRPADCTHACPQPCHTDPCPPCRKRLRRRCDCGLVILHHICSEWTIANEEVRTNMTSCGNNCPKLLSCGHLCSSVCHAGPCPGPETCTKKMTVRCSCKFRKKEMLCTDYQKLGKIECNDACASKKAKANAEKEEKLKQKREEEERLRQIELEQFDRKMNKTSKSRRRRLTHQTEDDEKPSVFKNPAFKKAGIAIATIVLLLFAFYLFSQTDK